MKHSEHDDQETIKKLNSIEISENYDIFVFDYRKYKNMHKRDLQKCNVASGRITSIHLIKGKIEVIDIQLDTGYMVRIIPNRF